jgi:nitrate reductase gamma subunit
MTTVLFVAFPYVAVFLAAGVGLYRYRTGRVSDSSARSPSPDSAKLFWGFVPWHYALALILLAHVFAWLFPKLTGAVLGFGTRLFVFEVAGLALALFAALGIVILIAKRPASLRTKAVASSMDWIFLSVLLVEVLTGAAVAWLDRWGSHWFLSTAAPWLWSLVTLHPDPSTVASLPLLIQLHFLLGFGVIVLFPFTRLAYVVMFPIYRLAWSSPRPATSNIASAEPKE